MSWLFSRALVEASWPATSSDGEQSVQLSGNPIPQAYCAPDKMTDFSRLSRFGMTFKPLTADRGEELLMSFLAAFPARTSPQQEKAQESTGSEAGCGNTWRGWLAKFDPNSCSWRTAQCSFLEEEPESLQTLPRSGMTRGGLLWELPMSERRIKETDSGLWLTPRATDVGKGEGNETFIKRMGDRTDRCAQSLAAQVNNPKTWPTPIASDSRGSSGRPKDGKQVQLVDAVRMLPTPTWRDFKSGTGAQPREGHSPPLSNVVGGTLNPNWTEWLMGWPVGWTDLKPLGTDKCPSVQQQHGEN